MSQPLFYTGDLFTLFDTIEEARTLAITCNLSRSTPDGRGLCASRYGPMGKGTALQAARRWPGFRLFWANAVLSQGQGLRWAAMPHPELPGAFLGGLATKYDWWKPSPEGLIRESLQALRAWVDERSSERSPVLLPLPGASHGMLSVATCQEMCLATLNERFLVCQLP